jgi:hypothetical protein
MVNSDDPDRDQLESNSPRIEPSRERDFEDRKYYNLPQKDKPHSRKCQLELEILGLGDGLDINCTPCEHCREWAAWGLEEAVRQERIEMEKKRQRPEEKRRLEYANALEEAWQEQMWGFLYQDLAIR